MIVNPIAHIKTDFKEKFGIPRQSGRIDAEGEIHFLPAYKTPTPSVVSRAFPT